MNQHSRRLPTVLVILALMSAGCVTSTAAQSVNGKAFVVNGSIFQGTSVFNCDATGDKPVCYQVTEEPLK
jgi:hypothetical protein